LAIQDAVVAHDVIMKALTHTSSPLSINLLKPYEEIRRPSVSQIQKIQSIQANLIGIKNPFLLELRRILMPLLSRTPLFNKMRHKIALGSQPIDVVTSHFRK
jgi:2-polyprenyl-6-methoxyphenol hydroxylase-like FAD-dependent oxidoreductase